MKTAALFLLMSVGACRYASGALPATCASATGIVMTKTSVLLHCNTDWPSTPQFTELWRVPADWSRDPRQRGTLLSVNAAVAETVQHDNAYRLITFDKELTPGVAYYLLLSMPTDQSPEGQVKVLLSTAPEAVIERDKIREHWGEVFIVRSPVALSPELSPTRKFTEFNGADRTVHEACILILYEEQRSTNGTCTPQPADPRRLANAGVVRVQLLDGRLTQAKVGAGVTGLVNIFGETVKVQTKVDKPIELAAVPSTKDAAAWYLKFGYQRVQGSPYSLSLDLKFNPVLTHFGPLDIQPDIVVDIAQNESPSANPRSSDTIRLGGSLYYLRMLDPTTRPALAGIDVKPGAVLETDRLGSKKNILPNAESQFYLRGLYNTTEMQTRRHPNAPARYGYSIGIFFGMEAGKSVVEQTFKNKAKTSSIKVPTYSIARLWPRIRQTYEVGRVTFDMNSTLKYLRNPEVTGHENTDGTLNLRYVKGWRFYDEASASIALDRGKHANFVVMWKRGAKAPNWTNINTVITGFGFAY